MNNVNFRIGTSIGKIAMDSAGIPSSNSKTLHTPNTKVYWIETSSGGPWS